MDLRLYFRKLREVESGIEEEFTLVSSVGTADGGKAGVVSEVSREVAAKLIVEGRATLATEAERNEYRAKQAAAREAADRSDLAKQIQVAILSDPAFQAPAGNKRNPTNGGK